MKLPLDQARICLECDTLHDLESCPECGSASYFYLSRWIPPQRPPDAARKKEEAEEKPLAQLLEPKKKRHILRNALLAGASLLAVYGLLFRPSKKKPEE